MKPLLEVEDIHTYYGTSHVLQGVSLDVFAGEGIAVLGRNGAGKTTTIRSIVQLTPPRRGSVRFDGQAIHSSPPYRVARMGVALVPQGRGVFGELTVRENLTFAQRRGAWTLERVLELFPVLRERLKAHGNQLSGGEQQMLSIARALLLAPRLLLLDEPSEGLAPLVIRQVAEVLGRLKAQGLPFVLVEQNLSLALEHADRVYVLNKGQVVFTGTPGQLWADEELHHRYLGV